MTDNINGLIKKYILWPELINDFQKHIHFGNIKVKDFYNSISNTIITKKSIDHHIAKFYLTNEKLSKSRINSQDVLGQEELKDYKIYQNTVNELSQELLSYIMVCSIVEARHINFGGVYRKWERFLNRKETPVENNPQYLLREVAMPQWFGVIQTHPDSQEFLNELFASYKDDFANDNEFENFVKFATNIVSDVRIIFNNLEKNENYDFRNNGYLNIAKNFLTINIKDQTLETVFKYLITIFEDGSKFEGGYGGYAWSAIVKHGLKFIQGQINAEMFVDQAFSLEHNNGNMFNKDFLFNSTENIYLNHSIYKEEHQSQNYISNEVPFSQILLTAQHLGVLGDLFSLEPILNTLNDVNVEQLYNDLGKKGAFEDFGPNYSLQYFSNHIEAIRLNYTNIHSQIKKITIALGDDGERLLKKTYCDIDFKSFLYSLTTISPVQLYDIKYATIPSSNNRFFTLWNYLHNEYYKPHYNSNSNSNVQSPVKKSFSFKLYDLHNVPNDMFNKHVIGGKAWGLVNMKQLDIPIPKARIFTTDCCNSYYNHPKLFTDFLKKVLPTFKNYLQDYNHNPILCSVRSGAPVSMPGMMNTILNIGFDDSNYQYFCDKMGKPIVDKCIAKFLELFCYARVNQKIVFNLSLEKNLSLFKDVLTEFNINYSKENVFPLTYQEQIEQSLYAVFDSWNSKRAIAYRNEKNIEHNIGTAAIVQQMVFGNLNENSCTGVVFSRDCLTGENKLVGEFLPKAQGEDVVSGNITPFPITEFEKFNKNAYEQLKTISKQLERQTGQIQDIEFTVEDGKLYILQHRQAVCSPIASIKMLEDSSLDHTTLLDQIEPKTLQKNFTVVTNELPYANGLSANSGVVSGIVVTSEVDIQKYDSIYKEKIKNNPRFGWIFYSELTSPEHMPIMNKTHAFITEQGGFTSHAAIIARSLNKPCIVGMGNEIGNTFSSGEVITIDGTNGKIWMGEQTVIENNRVAKLFTKIIIDSHNIKLEDIDKKEFYKHINALNNENKSWVFNFPEAYYCTEHFLKKENFLNLGDKVAILLAAERMKNKKNHKNNFK